MDLYVFVIPINDYEGTGIFEKHAYFQGSRCPTHDEVVKRLTELHEDEVRMSEDPNVGVGPSVFEFKQCLDTIGMISDRNGNKDRKLPFLEGKMIQTNVFVDNPKWERFGYQSIVVKKICPQRFEEPFVSWFDGGQNY